jgi:hypothetical protein
MVKVFAQFTDRTERERERVRELDLESSCGKSERETELDQRELKRQREKARSLLFSVEQKRCKSHGYGLWIRIVIHFPQGSPTI